MQYSELDVALFNRLAKALSLKRLLKRRDNYPTQGEQTYLCGAREFAIVSHIPALTMAGKEYRRAVVYVDETVRDGMLEQYLLGDTDGNPV